MLCEKCKIREATIQLTEVVNGVKTEHSYCAQCAQQENFGQLSALFDGEFPFAKILSALLDNETKTESGEYARIVCPTCGTSYQEFVENSRFGCRDCYELFDLLIRENIKQLQGSDTHKGKHPKYGVKMMPESLIRDLPGGQESGKTDAAAETSQERSAEAVLAELKLKLKDAVRKEEYEAAAALRDRIRQIEKEGRADA